MDIQNLISILLPRNYISSTAFHLDYSQVSTPFFCGKMSLIYIYKAYTYVIKFLVTIFSDFQTEKKNFIFIYINTIYVRCLYFIRFSIIIFTQHNIYSRLCGDDFFLLYTTRWGKLKWYLSRLLVYIIAA